MLNSSRNTLLLSFEDLKVLVKGNELEKLFKQDLSQLLSDERNELVDIAFENQHWEIVSLLQIGTSFATRGRVYEEIRPLNSRLEFKTYQAKDKKTRHEVIIRTEHVLSSIEYNVSLLGYSPYFIPILEKFRMKVDEDYDDVSFVFPIVESCSLEEFIERNDSLDGLVLLNLVAQLCSAVQTLHEQGLVHGNIRLDNTFVFKTFEGDVIKLGETWRSFKINTEDDSYGTPGYMCPEIYCDSSEDIVYTETVDIFSLGVVIINLLLFKEQGQIILYDYEHPQNLKNKTQLYKLLKHKVPTHLNELFCSLIISMIDENANRPKLEQVIHCIKAVGKEIYRRRNYYNKLFNTRGFYDIKIYFESQYP